MKLEKLTLKGRNNALLGPLIAVVLLCVIISLLTKRFLSAGNIMNVLRQMSVNALLSMGMLFVLLAGCIDLSIGSMAALSGCLMGVLLKNGVTNPVLLVSAGLTAGILVGLINGLLYTKLRLPHPFVSTLGMMQILRGVALIITDATPIMGFESDVQALGYNSINGFPVCFIAVLVVVIVSAVLLNETVLGKRIYSVGGNKEAARLSGINVDWTINICYIFSGFLAAFAGWVLIGRLGAAYPTAADGYEMNAVAACVIGGASFNGGKGTAFGTLLGSIFISVLNNGLNLLGATADIQKVAIGTVIIIAVLIDIMRARTDNKARMASQERAQLAHSQS